MKEPKQKMNVETVVAVLNQSKKDLTTDDLFLEIEDEDILDFLEEYDYEINEFLNKLIPVIMDRLKIRMAFAKSGEEREENE